MKEYVVAANMKYNAGAVNRGPGFIQAATPRGADCASAEDRHCWPQRGPAKTNPIPQLANPVFYFILVTSHTLRSGVKLDGLGVVM